jgi:outer membrane protein assembly factor BamD (BamD/ComL family)
MLPISSKANANDAKGEKYTFPQFIDSQLKIESNFVLGVAAFIGYKAQLSDYKVTNSSNTIYTGKSISGIYAGVSCNLEILYPTFPRFSRCRNIGQEEFQIAKNTNTISAYSQFISKYPNTPYSKECNQRRELVSYNVAIQSKDSIDSEYYISNYPQGQYNEIVKERRKVVIEDIYYQNAQQGDFANCELYIKRFPGGKFLKQVDSLIFATAKKGTYLDCDRYTKFFPNGSYASEINKIRMDKFNNHDDILYEIAINGNYIDCQEYLKQFPNGKHVDNINKQMKSYQIELDNREAYKKIKKGMPFEKIIKLLSFEKLGIMGGLFVGFGLFPESNDTNTYTGYIVIERYYLKLEKSKLIDWHIESKGVNSRKVYGEYTNPYDKKIISTINADLDI